MKEEDNIFTKKSDQKLFKGPNELRLLAGKDKEQHSTTASLSHREQIIKRISSLANCGGSKPSSVKLLSSQC